MAEEKHCLLKEEKPSFKRILEGKIDALEEEISLETEFYKEHGLYHERDPADIAEELDIAKKVLKKLDNIPECGKRIAQ